MTAETTHPLADLALSRLTAEGPGWTLDAAAREALTAALAATPSADLRDAVRALVSLAHFLHRRSSPAAARALVEVAGTAVDRLRERATPRALDRLRDRARAFALLQAERPGLRAPQYQHVTVRAPSPYRRVPARV